MLEVFDRYNEHREQQDKTRRTNRSRFARRGKVTEEY